MGLVVFQISFMNIVAILIIMITNLRIITVVLGITTIMVISITTLCIIVINIVI